MTRTRSCLQFCTRSALAFAARRLAVAVAVAATVVAGGGASGAERRAAAADRAGVLREAPAGPVILTYASVTPAPDAPPDGVRAALVRAVEDAENAARRAGGAALSAATFHWEERERALLWTRGQMAERRRRGEPVRLILAGHGLGATEASETARELLFHERDFVILLLLTVDAVKPDRYGSSAAYAAGTAIAGRLGTDYSFAAYDAAPAPDGRTLLAHINYHQAESTALHGSAMPHAENHRLTDPTGLLNHGNADDFAMPDLLADFRYAIAQALRTPGAPGGGRAR